MSAEEKIRSIIRENYPEVCEQSFLDFSLNYIQANVDEIVALMEEEE